MADDLTAIRMELAFMSAELPHISARVNSVGEQMNRIKIAKNKVWGPPGTHSVSSAPNAAKATGQWAAALTAWETLARSLLAFKQTVEETDAILHM